MYFELEPLSAQYFKISARRPAVKQLQVDWSSIAGEPGIEVQAVIYKAGGSWEYKDYSGKSRATLCVNLQANPSIEAWFVVSNKDRTKPAAGDVLWEGLAAKTAACDCQYPAGDYCWAGLRGVGSQFADPFEAFAWAISGSGAVAGISTEDAFRDRRATIWQDGRRHVLGGLFGVDYSVAFDVNDAGDAVGTSIDFDIDFDSGAQRAFLWRQGSMYDLGSLTGLASTRALGINKTGLIVGDGTSGGSRQVVIWKDCGPTPPTMQFGCTVLTPSSGSGVDVNDRGEVLIGSWPWDRSASTYPLGELPGPELATVFDVATQAFRPIASNVFASAINQRGDVVVVEQIGTFTNPPERSPPATSPIYRSRVHHANGSASVLPCPGSCEAFVINNLGSVVGWADDLGDQFIGFPVTWDQNGVVSPLPQYLPVGEFLQGAAILEPLGINSAGQIVGRGFLGSIGIGFELPRSSEASPHGSGCPSSGPRGTIPRG